jgi:DNA polymerase-3 subunit gamma/tau
MSYLVLARKLRPARFKDLIGQESISQTLINAIAMDRVAHAFLFTGPRGTGKTSTARILTKALNCTQPVEYEPCNQCENCEEINKGISSDVMEIDAASNRGIENIRELRAGIKFSPAKCRYKTYIIDEVHMLTTESFNALLKTLEEPPAHIKFILATTDHHKIPSTVISRCQRFDFANVSSPVLFKFLKKVAQDEKIEISDNSLNLIVTSASGGVRDALTKMDMLISFGGVQVEDDQVAKLLGLHDGVEIDSLLESIIGKDLEQALSIFHTLSGKGRSLTHLVIGLMKSVKDLSMVAGLSTAKMQWKEFLPGQLELYQKLAEKVTPETLQQYFQILLEIENQVKGSTQAQICFEMGLIKLCTVDSLIGVAEVISLLKGDRRVKKKLQPDLKPPKNRIQKRDDYLPPSKVAIIQESPPTDSRPEFDYSNLDESQVIRKKPAVFPQDNSPVPLEGTNYTVGKIEGNNKEVISDKDKKAEIVAEPAPQMVTETKPPPCPKRDKTWRGFVDFVAKSTHKYLVSLLRTADIIELSEKRMLIGVQNINLLNEEKKQLIKENAQNFFTPKIEVIFKEQETQIESSLKGLKDAAEEKAEQALKEAARVSPQVMMVQEVFPGSKINYIKPLRTEND